MEGGREGEREGGGKEEGGGERRVEGAFTPPLKMVLFSPSYFHTLRLWVQPTYVYPLYFLKY